MDTTPETNQLIAADQHRLEDDNFFSASVYWRMCDLARDLERERDDARRLAAEARDILDSEGYAVNPLPWESTENTPARSSGTD